MATGGRWCGWWGFILSGFSFVHMLCQVWLIRGKSSNSNWPSLAGSLQSVAGVSQKNKNS